MVLENQLRAVSGGHPRATGILVALIVGVLVPSLRVALAQEEKPSGTTTQAPSTPAQEDKPKSPQDDKKKEPEVPPGLHLIPLVGDPDWSFHYQATAIEQARGSIHSPYASNLSLQEHAEHAMSYTTTIFLARRLWEGAMVVFNPEIAGGNGLSEASGMAGFPNGEITRVNRPAPTPYVARFYLEQTLNFGDLTEKVEAGPNQLIDRRSPSRLEIRLGKMAVGDVFDINPYAHDPRTQFLNWALMENGAWDYPADTRGYTYGATIELAQPGWAVRYGLWMVPESANGLPLDLNVSANHGQAVEFDRHGSIDDHPGTVRLLAYLNNADMGSFRQTINNPALGMDVTQTRRNGRPKVGVGLNADQEISKEVGVFLRAGWDDGRTETFAFTQIDRTLTPGVSIRGTSWDRPDDTVGVAYVLNGLSSNQESYLARGGKGFIIGDGQIHYGLEQILEVYYAFRILGVLTLSGDYQYVRNPAYNADRGPVNIFALRVHIDF
jgi:high affinity Mn2+ porin